MDFNTNRHKRSKAILFAKIICRRDEDGKIVRPVT